MTSASRHRGRRAAIGLGVTLLLGVLYVLSIGPVAAVQARQERWGKIPRIYAPLLAVSDSGLRVARTLNWYLEWWLPPMVFLEANGELTPFPDCALMPEEE